MKKHFRNFGGSIEQITFLPGYALQRCHQQAKRVPKPVRELLKGASHLNEVEWDTKSKTASRVPMWERWVI